MPHLSRRLSITSSTPFFRRRRSAPPSADWRRPWRTPAPAPMDSRPALQAAFCIDVRSEVFRRALEAVDPGIQTLGFAGFFGLAASHRRFASDVRELRLPVLLNPRVMSCSGGPDDAARDQTARFKARAKRAWGRFKLAAVSSFAFVEATGPIYAAKLFRDALGLADAPAPHDPPPRFDPALDLASPHRCGRDRAAGDVPDHQFRQAGASGRAWRQRRQQSPRQRAALRRVRRLFGRGQRAAAGVAAE